jgi:SAM-dependent methyltransferase
MSQSIITSTYVDKCVISGNPVRKILDFGQHAYADTFIKETQLNLSEPVFPLQLTLNQESGGIQLGYVSHAEDRYSLYNYSYTSSNSGVARKHWENYAQWVKDRYCPEGLIVEIGSNDGYLIKQFNADSNRLLGIDSSESMCSIAEEAGVPTMCNLFSFEISQLVEQKYGRANIIMANNVLNHANNPVDFVCGVAKLLEVDGVFIFELPYWVSMIKSNRFTDMVYHEHITYFTIKSAWNLLQQAGLEIVDFEIVDYHGGSIRVVARHSQGKEMPDNVAFAIIKETSLGMFRPEFYAELQKKFEAQRNAWMANFYQLLHNDPTAVVIGVGAAAKANTWLTWHGLNKTHLHCITDASEHKKGKYTPLSRIQILDDGEFANHPNPYALVLSWNIGDGLKKAILSINPNTRFISQ